MISSDENDFPSALMELQRPLYWKRKGKGSAYFGTGVFLFRLPGKKSILNLTSREIHFLSFSTVIITEKSALAVLDAL